LTIGIDDNDAEGAPKEEKKVDSVKEILAPVI